jgi:hypothetical protein
MIKLIKDAAPIAWRLFQSLSSSDSKENSNEDICIDVVDRAYFDGIGIIVAYRMPATERHAASDQ